MNDNLIPQTSRGNYILSLAKVLLDDIELSRLPPESLLLKCTRLARLIDDKETLAWLGFELRGYRQGDPLTEKYTKLTGRVIDKKTIVYGPLSEVQAIIQTCEIQLKGKQLASLGGDNIYSVTLQLHEQSLELTTEIIKYTGVRGAVMAELHRFVAEVFQEKAFSGLAEGIFEKYKAKTDARLLSEHADVLKKLPSIYDRLAEGDSESVSQALTTCRRLLDGFADSIYPPQEGTVKIGDQELGIGQQHHKNRINVYVSEHIKSQSRRTRLRQTLSNLYDRVSTGVHEEVDFEEAQALLLTTYFFVGEILSLDNATRMSITLEEPTEE